MWRPEVRRWPIKRTTIADTLDTHDQNWIWLVDVMLPVLTFLVKIFENCCDIPEVLHNASPYYCQVTIGSAYIFKVITCDIFMYIMIDILCFVDCDILCYGVSELK